MAINVIGEIDDSALYGSLWRPSNPNDVGRRQSVRNRVETVPV